MQPGTGMRRALLCSGAVAGGLALAFGVATMTGRAEAGDPGRFAVPAPAVDAVAAPAGTETAIFAGGCFWGVQGVFQHVRGVTGTLAGYDGGTPDTATYEQVSSGTTGHAESVEVRFDPRVVSYGQLLRVFFSVALDPTQIDAQFPDQGTQYRSVLFVGTPEQRRVAAAYIAELDARHVFSRKVATAIAADSGFHPAEAYHQNYLVHDPDSPYIATYDQPKIAALRQVLPADYQSEPVLALADAPEAGGVTAALK